jgi:endoglucanase
VNSIRSTGAAQPLMLGGLSWASDLSQWRAFEQRDPRRQLIASEHTYGGLSPCSGGCLSSVLATSRQVPVVFGELGETDCASGYSYDGAPTPYGAGFRAHFRALGSPIRP